MSLAAITRREVRKTPYLYDAIRAGIVNYSAAARMLDLEGQDTAVSVSLQRLNKELPPLEMARIDANITISSDEINQQVKIVVEGPVDAKILSHSFGLMREICDRVAFIHEGKVHCVGDPTQSIRTYYELTGEK